MRTCGVTAVEILVLGVVLGACTGDPAPPATPNTTTGDASTGAVGSEAADGSSTGDTEGEAPTTATVLHGWGLQTLAPLEESVPVELFKSEVHVIAAQIGVEPQSITLRPMKRKWASCSSKGNLTFDTDLLKQPAAFRRKAIVHELLHLKVPNHSKLFKAIEKMYIEQLGG